MKIVKQYNDFACVLACFESLFHDQGQSVSQLDLLKKYPKECNVGTDIEGAFELSTDSLKTIGSDFNCSCELTHDFEPADGRDHFIVTTEGEKHCVRISRYLGEHKFEVMDPNINRDNDKEELATFDIKSWIPTRKPLFLRISTG